MRKGRQTVSLTFLIVLCLIALNGEVAAEADYHIGTDDVLAISVSDVKDLDQVVVVRPDGLVTLQLLGDVRASGLTVAELSTRLNELYGKSVRAAQVTVAVREIRSRPVFFIGAVVKPGPMQLTQELTLLQAVSVVGGFAPSADLQSAFVLRGNERIPVDFVKLMQRGDVGQNIKLIPGDTVVIPAAGVVYVQGEVKNPGAVTLTRDLTVLAAIAQAGGFTPFASRSRINLIRMNGTHKETIRINVNALVSDPGKTPDLSLKADDIIVVP
jgi:polysaccharide biosynthesis/export protein